MGSSLALDSVGRQTRGCSTRSWKQHKWSGEFAVNPLVGTEVSSAKIEERVPVDKPASRALPAAQIIRIRTIRKCSLAPSRDSTIQRTVYFFCFAWGKNTRYVL
jgi:hypothetical protein